jgi:hypothetical protein
MKRLKNLISRIFTEINNYKNTVLCEKRIDHQEFYTKYRSASKETAELVNFMLDEIENTLPDAKWVEYIKQSTNETIGFNIK